MQEKCARDDVLSDFIGVRQGAKYRGVIIRVLNEDPYFGEIRAGRKARVTDLIQTQNENQNENGNHWTVRQNVIFPSKINDEN